MKLTLVAKKPQTESVTTFVLHPEQPMAWKPGQYMHYTLPHDNVDDRGDKRWFTISAAPCEGGDLAITTRLIGDKGSSFKRALAALEVGDSLEAEGPEGDFVVDDPSKRYVFIAGGIGITPFHSMLLQLDHDGQPLNVDLMYANRDDNYVFGEQLQELAQRHKEFKIHKFTDPQHIEAADIQEVADDVSQPVFYISGPEPMVKHYADVLKGMGVPEDHIKLDDFPGYPTY